MNAERQEENRERRKKWKFLWLLFLCILSVALLWSMAWFININQVSIDTRDEEIGVKIGANIEMSLDGKTWFYEGDIPNAREYKYMDVTSDGETFYWPTYLTTEYGDIDGSNDQTVTEKAPELASEFKDVTNDEGYFRKITLYLRTEDAVDVYLSDASGINNSENIFLTDIEHGQLQRESSFGIQSKFSADAIIGATRVSFHEITDPLVTTGAGSQLQVSVPEKYRHRLKCVWIPCDNFKLEMRKTVIDQRGTVGESATLENRISDEVSEIKTNGYGYLTPSGTQMVMHTYEAEDYYSGDVLVGGLASAYTNLASANGTLINSAKPIVSFSGDNGSMQYRAIDVYIWAEGTDREASVALQGGKFTYKIALIGINKNDVEDIRAEDFSYSGSSSGGNFTYIGDREDKDKISFSYSLNGYEWTTLGSGTIPVLKQEGKDKTVYLRIKENLYQKCSNVVELTIPKAH